MVANVSLNGLTSGLKTVFLSVRSFNGFEEKIVVTVIELEFICQTNTLFQKCTCTFFSYTLSN